MIPAEDGCDECSPSNVRFGPKAAFSTIPFIATFALVTLVAYRKVFPLLAAKTNQPRDRNTLPRPATAREPSTQTLVRRIAAFTFSSTIALSAVLTELLLCEISNSFNPTARTIALQITVASLLGLLVIAIPLLGIHTVVARNGYGAKDESRVNLRFQWILEAAGYAAFLVGFWALGALLPQSAADHATWSLFQACLDRLAITGVTLMALLSGFASVSSIWQNFGPKVKPVMETDINRKQAGLEATIDMVTEKKEQLERIQRKMPDSSSQTFWARTIGTFRGDKDEQERQTLEMEISGLETMAGSLESTLNILRTRRSDQLRSTTPLGRMSLALSLTFSFYCIYRICTTVFNISRRLLLSRDETKSETDPVTYAIALFARHVYPSLDQASWAQQISFLLSGAMLLASFSAVTQTFNLFARFMPSLLQATRTNFALLISQVSGMYVISSALMLRGMMPEQVGSVINGALGEGLLEPAWVQRWSDGWFMAAVLLTAAGIGLGRKLGGVEWEEDERWELGRMAGKSS